MITFPKPRAFANCLIPRDDKEKFLGEWLTESSLSMLFAGSGIGKTILSLEIAFAVATGSPLFNWQGHKPKKVLYIDGEMTAAVMDRRCEQLLNSKLGYSGLVENLELISCDDFPDNQIPNLSTTVGQQAFAEIAKNYDLIIFDNYVTIFRPVPKDGDSDVTVWERCQPFLLDLRSKGKAVLLVHHAGKSGAQLGTSRKEFIVDNILEISRFLPMLKERLAQGQELVIRFEKERHATESRPNLWINFWNNPGDLQQQWDWRTEREQIKDVIKTLLFKRYSVNLVSAYTGVHREEVKRVNDEINAFRGARSTTAEDNF